MSEQEIVERIAERVAEKLARKMAGISPDRVYPAEEAAELIGIVSQRRAKTIRAIPVAELPFVRYGPNNGLIGYWGRDLIEYIKHHRKTA